MEDGKARCAFQIDVQERFTLMIPLFLLQEIIKQSLTRKVPYAVPFCSPL